MNNPVKVEIEIREFHEMLNDAYRRGIIAQLFNVEILDEVKNEKPKKRAERMAFLLSIEGLSGTDITDIERGSFLDEWSPAITNAIDDLERRYGDTR